MKLTLYKNSSSNNTIGKTIADSVEITINLKATCDVVNPTIILSNIVGVDFLEFNYATIDELNRSYFITSVDSMNRELWKLTMTCDVLETYQVSIKGSVARLRRGLQVGDYHAEGMDSTVNSNVTKYLSNITLPDDEHTNVLTVVEGGELI